MNKSVRHSQRCEGKRKETESGRPDNSYYDRERRVRRWFGEVIITCYQMTVLVEAGGFGNASAPMFEDSRRCVSCGVRELLLIVYVVKIREGGGCVFEGGIGRGSSRNDGVANRLVSRTIRC